MMRQIYKESVYYFRQHPEEIRKAWTRPHSHPHGRLFQFLSPDRRVHAIRGETVGCPLMIARSDYIAWTPELTERCRKEITNSIEQITDQELQALGHIQSDCDQTIRVPQWLHDHVYALTPGANDPEVLVGLRMFLPVPNDEENNDADVV